ncbi:MAG: hypothetical protein IPO56_13645 [Flavobacteriales bacterium]|nr:hypothetical protein [Flavobacteriales bacterium]
MAVLSDCSFDRFTGDGPVVMKVEEAHVVIQSIQSGVQAAWIGIGNEYLTESVVAK